MEKRSESMNTTASSPASVTVVGQPLGRFTVWPPLSVEVHMVGNRRHSNAWIAALMPVELTCDEWGSGTTEQEAVDDLEDVVSEMWAAFQEEPEANFSSEMLAYKKLLFSAVTVNST